MTTMPLIILPDPLLRKVSEPVERVDDDLKKLAGDMLETMYEAPGIGLAAIQVGVPRRMLVVDVTSKGEDEDGNAPEQEREKNPLVVINPTILSSSDERSVYEEGCLSIPEFFAEVERPASVRVGYTDLDGKQQEIEADGLLATCLQHEIDHLDGALFIDYLSKLKRDRVIKRFAKVARQQKL